MVIHKRILIVSAAFFPENSPRSFRATELAKEFSRQGHEVTVATLNRGKEAEELAARNGIALLCLPKLWSKPVRVYPRGLPNFLSRAMARFLLMTIEYPDVELMFRYRQALAGMRGYDLLISVAVPYSVHWGVAWAWRRDMARCWVADCGDPFMRATTDSFRKLFYFRYLEKWFSRKADFITIPNIRMIGNYYPEFHSKIVEITQGFNFEETRSRLPGYTPNPVPTFAFAGTLFQSTRDPRPLLQYLVGLNHDFKFLVFTAQRSLVEPYLEQGRGRIELREPIPRDQLLPVLAGMEFLVNISFDEKVQSPSKLIDYLLVGRPVLSLQSGEADERRINEFLNGDYSQRFELDDFEKFRIENVVSRFLGLLEKRILDRT